MSTYELIPSAQIPGKPEAPGSYGLQRAILVDNAQWFIRVRWAVIGVLVASGFIGRLLQGTLLHLGVVPPITWPWVLAGILTIANVAFALLTRRLSDSSPARAVESDVWLQIVVDLAIVTTLVHIAGSTGTFAAFTYLFHIVLACIFLRRAQSLVVLALAATLYGSCVALEISGVLAPSCILTRPAPSEDDAFLATVSAASAIAIWLVVWYLVSRLSAAVQKRDRQLSLANEQLLAAHEAKNQQMLRTAHDLKAPFSGIESNIQVLRASHWSEVPESVQEIVERIEVRAMTLSERINDILILGDLRSKATQEVQVVPVDLQSALHQVIEDLGEKAREREVAINVNVPTIAVPGEPRQIAVLFSNLIANAILYSYTGGTVDVTAAEDGERIVVRVADHGIGISDASLPRIFEEYYRSKEAARFNKLSTGLGLAIVRQVAQNMGYRIRVSSEEGKGSTFEVSIPASRH